MSASSQSAGTQSGGTQSGGTAPAGAKSAGSQPGPRPTGRLARRDDGIYLLLDRLFTAAPVDVWASLTVAEELATWLGTHTGSPASGAIKFRFGLPSQPGSQPGPEVEAEWVYLSILECEPPRRLLVDLGAASPSASPSAPVAGSDGNQRVFFHLSQGTGLTTLTVGERLQTSATPSATLSPSAAAQISVEAARLGPVWDYRLDCLTAARAGTRLPHFAPYIPAQTRYYRELIVPETHL